MMWAIILLIVLIIVIILLVFWGIYNRIIRTENQIDNAWAQIDVQMKRRADLIPNLMETVKGYMTHERGTMESVTNARGAIMSAKTPQESNDANNMLTGALKTLFAVAESYPDLKANQNFLQLQDELTHTEDKIAYSRQHYNDSVLSYNNTIETFPGNFFAHRMGRKAREMLQIPEASKEVPKVSF
ncbi:MAG: LemA family protein [Thermoplasmata archaeon]|nr:LemA family protein [Thermoplasmata archaeon]MBE3136219.1 LemA family protein [Thermoplasmata archaeon]MBE3139208.1 LemA family protein [Thermoplasmata archaeon]